MVITYHGEDYFKFSIGDTTILVDPTDQRSFRGANLVINTVRPAVVDRPDDDEDVFWIDHQGEYEVEGIRIRGWQSSWSGDGDELEEKTVYMVDFDDFRLVFLGFLDESPNPEMLEYLEDIDVAVAPANGDGVIDSSELAQLLRQIEPSLILPSLYSKKGDLKKFLAEFNREECDMEEKITIKTSDLKAGAMEIRCLKE